MARSLLSRKAMLKQRQPIANTSKVGKTKMLKCNYQLATIMLIKMA